MKAFYQSNQCSVVAIHGDGYATILVGKTQCKVHQSAITIS